MITLILLPVLVKYWNTSGTDLSSSYIGCRLLASGQEHALYDHDATRFDRIGDGSPWSSVGKEHGYRSLAHPYVQIPLWAAALRPACLGLEFPAFLHSFLIVIFACLVGMLELVARHWAPRFLDVRLMACATIALALSTPYRYTLWLAQTHPIFVLATLLALVLADKGRWRLAGLALALAASVKITPGFVALYWLARGQWRSTIWFAVCLTAAVALSIGVSGSAVFIDYVDSMRRVSHVLLLAFNNQSFAAWWAGRDLPHSDLWQWTMHVLPPSLSAIGLVGTVVCALAGGLIDKRADRPGIGAVLALVGAMAFASIAWSHYYIVIVPALMVLLHHAASKPGWARPVAAISAIVWLLNVQPLAINPRDPGVVGAIALVRSHFYSAAILMVVLGTCGVLLRGRAGRSAAL